MAYDVELAERVRRLLADIPDVREQAMFGGLGFLVGGRMAVAASSHGGLMVRVGAESAEELLATTAAEPMQMKGRHIRGWLHIDGDQLRSRPHLAAWVAIGVDAV